ncbi:MAG TPA: Ig-like domain-containing protein [Bdellovibrionota bacterium]|nr:Ig-like domain-containing protein [Bdellovibrionota bacterium]
MKESDTSALLGFLLALSFLFAVPVVGCGSSATKSDLVPEEKVQTSSFQTSYSETLNGEDFSRITGRLEILQVDNFDNPVEERMYLLEDSVSHKTFELHFPGEPPAGLSTGSMISVQGAVEDQTIHLEAVSYSPIGALSKEAMGIEVLETPMVSEAALSNVRRAVILLVDFIDSPSSCTTESQAANIMFTGVQSVDGLYRETSFGVVSFPGDTNGNGQSDVYRVLISGSKTESCDPITWATRADEAAVNIGIDLNLYQHKVYVLPSDSTCTWAGLGNVGCAGVCRAWVKYCVADIFAHELGHNLGMAHASADWNNDGVNDSEYGDITDFMGMSNNIFRQVNGRHKEQMGWLPPSQIMEIGSAGTWTVTVAPLETEPALALYPQLVKIPKAGTGEYYYVSYRRKIGYDTALGSRYTDKASIHYNKSLSSNTFFVDTLVDSGVFQDSNSWITMTQLSHDTNGVTVRVDVPVINDAILSMTFPASGATVTGTIPVSATASESLGVVSVQFKLDGVNLGAEDTTSPYSVSWDTTSVPNGAHSLAAVARDAAGNTTATRAIVVTVSNSQPVDNIPPAVSMQFPADGETVSGVVSVWAKASDSFGVVGVQFKKNGYDWVEDTTFPYAFSWDTTRERNGTHSLTAVARDAAGHTTTSSAVVVTVSNLDTTPPFVWITYPASGATVSGTLSVSATASDINGVAGVQFKLDGGNLGAEITTGTFYSISWNTTSVTNGSHSLSAVARDAAGNTATASAVNVTVSNSSLDTSPPAVSMTSPASGATVSGTLSVSATASDNIGVAGVQFKLDGANLGAEDTTSPYSISWNTTSTANGSHSLSAVARDAAGNTATSSAVNVTVSNLSSDTTPPTISMISPTFGAIVSGTISVYATASDNIGVAGVQFKLDGVNLGAEVTTSPYYFYWNTTSAANGSHSLSAVARDAAGNTATTAAVNVTVSNLDTIPPTVSMTSPASGATVSGTTSVSAAASDNNGVAGVQFKLDGVNLGVEDTTSPYSISWNTTSVANGSHSLSAVARDAKGNTATSSAVNVTVSNITSQPPTANAGPDFSIVKDTVKTVYGSGSDPDGTIASYWWTISSTSCALSTPDASQTNIKCTVAGTFTLTLKVTDNQGLTASDSAIVTVTSPGGGGGGCGSCRIQ